MTHPLPEHQGQAVPERVGGYLRFEGMTWPNPADPHEVQHTLRYGTPSREDLLFAASVMAAYAQLVELPARTRNQRVAKLRQTGTPND